MDDFQLLHEQIVAWQERRFTVVTGAMTLVTVLCGFILSDAKQSWTREQGGILICMILFCASLFTWYAGWQNSIIGSFVRSMREPDPNALGWEAAAKMLNLRGDLSGYVSLNKIIALTFFVTAIGTNSILSLHCPADKKKSAKYIFRGATALLIVALIALAYPRLILPNYDDVWREIRIEHSQLHSKSKTIKP